MKDTKIEKSRLAQFCDTIIMQAREALYDREDDILKAWHENIEEAQQNDKKFPALKLSIGATVDLEESKIETTLRFTAVYQSRIEADIEDPNQGELPGLGKALGKYVDAVIKDNNRKLDELNEMEVASRRMSAEADEEDVMIHDDTDEGPAIVEVEDDFEIQRLLNNLEGTPKLQRKKALAKMLETHGAETIRKFDEYRQWNGPDEHLKKLIQTMINELPESQPEGSSDDY